MGQPLQSVHRLRHWQQQASMHGWPSSNRLLFRRPSLILVTQAAALQRQGAAAPDLTDLSRNAVMPERPSVLQQHLQARYSDLNMFSYTGLTACTAWSTLCHASDTQRRINVPMQDTALLASGLTRNTTADLVGLTNIQLAHYK